jgi:hypothetical protein
MGLEAGGKARRAGQDFFFGHVDGRPHAMGISLP